MDNCIQALGGVWRGESPLGEKCPPQTFAFQYLVPEGVRELTAHAAGAVDNQFADLISGYEDATVADKQSGDRRFAGTDRSGNANHRQKSRCRGRH
jgi:hypothetical protein